MNYLNVNLMNHVQVMHAKNYVTLMKEIFKNVYKWKCLWVRRLCTVKMLILPK